MAEFSAGGIQFDVVTSVEAGAIAGTNCALNSAISVLVLTVGGADTQAGVTVTIQ
jgi:hypothetical protein